MTLSFSDLLLTISNALLIPNIFFLLFLFSFSILQLGGLLAEYWDRYRFSSSFHKLVKAQMLGDCDTLGIEDINVEFGLPAKAFNIMLKSKKFDADKILDDLQLEVEKRLAHLNLGIRLGPVLGLAGTLIPLGPALVSLSTGDIATLSSKLVVAFSTTVLGLIIGGLCFFIHTIRHNWYMKDLNDIEFIVKRLKK